jgi:hypothetical protein
MTRVQLQRVILTDDAIAEFEQVALVKIPRGEVKRIRLLHGPVAEHPLFFIVGAIVCAAAGIAGVAMLFDGRFWKTGTLAALLLLASPVMLAAGVRHGPYLLVETKRGARKLGFGPRVPLDALPGFVASAREAGWTIES